MGVNEKKQQYENLEVNINKINDYETKRPVMIFTLRNSYSNCDQLVDKISVCCEWYLCDFRYDNSICLFGLMNFNIL